MAVGANLVARRRVLKVLRTILEAKSLAKDVANPSTRQGPSSGEVA